MKFFWRLIPVFLGVLATMAIGVVATGVAAYYYLQPGLPSAETIRDVKLQVPLRIYSRDGRLIAQIGEKRRSPVEYEEIPEVVVQAFLAAEDDRFFVHPGFDYQGITRAAINLALTGSRSQGGSTITQQLAREYFLTRDRTFIRKARELILAVQIENEFTKPEILALYLNKIFLGQRAYGIAAAAEVYFGKTLAELNIAEAATIAGLPKAPSKYNPVSSSEEALQRRAYVLRRMYELDFIPEEEFDAALIFPMQSHLHGPKVDLDAPYVAEMARRDAVERYGQAAYTDGYIITTTVDSRLQTAARRALRTSLLEYDRRHGFRGAQTRAELQEIYDSFTSETSSAQADDAAVSVATEVRRLEDQALQAYLNKLPTIRDLYSGIVLSLGKDNSAEFFVRNIGRVEVSWDGLKWGRYIDDNRIGSPPKSVADMLQPGDVVRLLLTVDKGWLLAQVPDVQGALVSLDPMDGAIVALSGGFDYYANKFNRATQTKRQPGSSFKPFIYSAALENGFTSATIVNDAPVVFDDPSLEDSWRPQNYSRKFYGPTRLREGLVRSMNLVSVRALLETGVLNTLKHVEPFGFPASALPRDPSLALGSGGASPLDMAAAFSVFASGGYRVKPYVVDRIETATGEVQYIADPSYVCRACLDRWFDDRQLEDNGTKNVAALAGIENTAADEPEIIPNTEDSSAYAAEIPDYATAAEMIEQAGNWRPQFEETPLFYGGVNSPVRVVTAQNGYIIYDMMRDVIRRGTGRRARELGRQDLGGKTGTSNDRRDAWFSGYNSRMVTISWVGFDEDKSLGAGEEGSRTALPMWKDYMGVALAGQSEAPLPQPEGIVTARVSATTGLVASAGAPDAIFEIFREGHVPELQVDGGDGGMSGNLSDSLESDDEGIF